MCAAFGVGARPNSPILDSIAGNFTSGINFAMAGATARNSSVWSHNSGFNTPFSLNIQVSWLLRYKVRLQFAAERNYSTYSSCVQLDSSFYPSNRSGIIKLTLHLVLSAKLILTFKVSLQLASRCQQ